MPPSPLPRPRRRTPGWAERVSTGVLAFAVALALAATLGNLGGWHLLVVRSGSMSPALEVGDLVVSRSWPVARIRPGDVITFRRPPLSRVLVTHRVVAVARTEDGYAVQTRGDANRTAETTTVPSTGSLGRMQTRIPTGLVLDRASDPRSQSAAILLLCGLTAGALLRRIWGRP